MDLNKLLELCTTSLSRIKSYFLKTGFVKCPYEHTLFIKNHEGGKIVIVCLYIDELIYIGNDIAMFNRLKTSMMTEFEMTDLGKMYYFLGIEVKQTTNRIFVGQKSYTEAMLKRFHIIDCNVMQHPIIPGTKLTKDIEGQKVDNIDFNQIVDSLMYLTNTHPNLMYVVILISRFMESPIEAHL